MSTLLVTGATGNVGAEVVQALRDDGHVVRAAVRDPASHVTVEGVEYVGFDFAHPETFAPAFTDVSKLFLMRPPQLADTKRYINPAIDAARAAGVKQVVFLSLLGAENNPVVPHRQVEQYLEASGLAWTFLRAGFFMQNLSTTHVADIRAHDEILVPAGNGKTSFIDVRDIAAVAAKALTEPGHEFQAYPLTGSVALDYHEAAAIFTLVLQRRIAYNNPSIWRFITQMRQRGVELEFILAMVAIYSTTRFGLAKSVTPTVHELLGRKPRSLRTFVEDYRDCWTKQD